MCHGRLLLLVFFSRESSKYALLNLSISRSIRYMSRRMRTRSSETRRESEMMFRIPAVFLNTPSAMSRCVGSSLGSRGCRASGSGFSDTTLWTTMVWCSPSVGFSNDTHWSSPGVAGTLSTAAGTVSSAGESSLDTAVPSPADWEVTLSSFEAIPRKVRKHFH